MQVIRVRFPVIRVFFPLLVAVFCGNRNRGISGSYSGSCRYWFGGYFCSRINDTRYMKRTTLAMIAGLFAMATAAIAQPVFY